MRDDQLTIWVVEDDEVLAEITSFRLELLGYNVQMFFGGEKVLKVIEKSRENEEAGPDLVLMDLAISDTDGFELIHKIKADPLTMETPIMVFSSDGDLNAVQRTYTAGAHEFLVTPFDPIMLETKIERLLEAESVRK